MPMPGPVSTNRMRHEKIVDERASMCLQCFVPSSITRLALAVLLFTVLSARADEKRFNIRDYGARGDGVSLDTESFQRALDAAAVTPDSSVVVPAGTFLVGSLSLPGHTTLVVEADAIIQGADPRSIPD